MHRLRIIALLLFLTIPILLPAEVKSKPPSYDLEISIEPEAGSITVKGSVEVPLAEPAASNFKFNLHETLAIKKLLVNRKKATVAYVPAEGQLVNSRCQHREALL
jgi:hypothetical protein